MTIVESLFKEIESGREGHSQGYGMGLPKLEGLIDGVTRGTMTVIAAGTGQGKSSFALYSYLYRPLMEHLEDDNFKVLYVSLEMSAPMLFAKLLSIHIFETYGKVLTIKEILSRKKDYILSDEDYKLVSNCTDWLQKVEKKVQVWDKQLNSAGLYALIKTGLSQEGITVEEVDEKGNKKIDYTPNNPNLVYVVIIDHIGLLKPSSGNSKKSEIDTAVSQLIYLRNKYNISPVIIQQINREQSNVERFKQGRTSIQLSDLKESGDTSDAAEIVLAIYGPHRDKLNTYRGYDVKKLGDSFRTVTVLKSRYGASDVEVPLNFQGAINIFKEMPLPNEIYDYEKYLTPDYLLESDDGNDIDTSTETKFEFTL